ncbi:hypothetical protein LX32DRAFT_152276 [Colletotrichum zoysiae]|uniref:Uncharacterized protein n=1 Tax=Colletotrichum zoysiae TaxID=1216348 RepID=A0AAD9M5G3_9PEZI|nr:hypothetical protein LX32DRAFT_152276 [Colletotrichum zoysiae]
MRMRKRQEFRQGEPSIVKTWGGSSAVLKPVFPGLQISQGGGWRLNRPYPASHFSKSPDLPSKHAAIRPHQWGGGRWSRSHTPRCEGGGLGVYFCAPRAAWYDHALVPADPCAPPSEDVTETTLDDAGWRSSMMQSARKRSPDGSRPGTC